jgi:hypothetical protein
VCPDRGIINNMDEPERTTRILEGLDAPIDPSSLVALEVPLHLRKEMGRWPWPALVIAARISSGSSDGQIGTWICAEPRESDGIDRGNIGPVMAMNEAARDSTEWGVDIQPGGTVWDGRDAVIETGLVAEAVSMVPDRSDS